MHSYASENNSETILPTNFCASSQLDITQNPHSINKKLPYQIILKCTNNNQVIQTPIQKNIPSNSAVAFTFPYIIGQQYYLFIIIKTYQIDAQKQTNGYAYKLYAFTLNNNILQPADNFLTRNKIDDNGFKGPLRKAASLCNNKGITKKYCDYTVTGYLKKYLEYKYKIRLSTE